MLSATFHDWGGGADDPDFSIDLTWSTATIRTHEILYIICRNCYTSQGDPDSSFPYCTVCTQCTRVSSRVNPLLMHTLTLSHMDHLSIVYNINVRY